MNLWNEGKIEPVMMSDDDAEAQVSEEKSFSECGLSACVFF